MMGKIVKLPLYIDGGTVPCWCCTNTRSVIKPVCGSISYYGRVACQPKMSWLNFQYLCCLDECTDGRYAGTSGVFGDVINSL